MVDISSTISIVMSLLTKASAFWLRSETRHAPEFWQNLVHKITCSFVAI